MVSLGLSFQALLFSFIHTLVGSKLLSVANQGEKNPYRQQKIAQQKMLFIQVFGKQPSDMRGGVWESLESFFY